MWMCIDGHVYFCYVYESKFSLCNFSIQPYSDSPVVVSRSYTVRGPVDSVCVVRDHLLVHVARGDVWVTPLCTQAMAPTAEEVW